MSMKYIPPYPNTLRAIRKERNLRQLDVACKLGFTTTDRISKREKGMGCPSLVNLFKLAVIYEVEPHELYLHIWEHLNKYYFEKMNKVTS